MIDNDTMLMTNIFESADDWFTISAGKPIAEYSHLPHYMLDTYTYKDSREVTSERVSTVLSNKSETISLFFDEVNYFLKFHDFENDLTIQFNDDTGDLVLRRVNGRFSVIASRYCNGQHTVDHDDAFDSLNGALVRLQELSTVYA